MDLGQLDLRRAQFHSSGLSKPETLQSLYQLSLPGAQIESRLAGGG